MRHAAPCVDESLPGHGRRSALLQRARNAYIEPAGPRGRCLCALGTRFALFSSSFTHHSLRSFVMLSWALAFFIIAIIAAVFGFTGIAAGAAEIAKILFVVFVVLFLVSLVAGLLRRP